MLSLIITIFVIIVRYKKKKKPISPRLTKVNSITLPTNASFASFQSGQSRQFPLDDFAESKDALKRNGNSIASLTYVGIGLNDKRNSKRRISELKQIHPQSPNITPKTGGNKADVENVDMVNFNPRHYRNIPQKAMELL